MAPQLGWTCANAEVALTARVNKVLSIVVSLPER
jgi:hypothetical protein